MKSWQSAVGHLKSPAKVGYDQEHTVTYSNSIFCPSNQLDGFSDWGWNGKLKRSAKMPQEI